MNSLEKQNNRYIPWMVVGLMDFVTVIGFDDIIYNFQNQGLVAVFSWVLMTFFYVIPYNLIVAHLGSQFDQRGGGITSWMRETNGDKVGYFAAWFYWITGLPYVVDVANSVVISLGWIITGNGDIQSHMGNAWFGLLTAFIFVGFIWLQHFFKNKSLEIMSTIGGGAMFIMTILFVVMTFAGLAHGNPIATHPFHFTNFLPHKIDMHFLAAFGLFVFAMNGSELAAPYTKDMKNPSRDFPKALKMIAIMTMFLTLFGTFSLGVYFNAHNLPNDLKMNGSYYAFQAIGKQFGMGDWLMYIFAFVQGIYMLAQLAVILDASTRIFLGDVAKKYMPKQLTKITEDGLPINGYWLTTVICGIIMALAGMLPEINDIFNWLLNLNGIVSPASTLFLFWAYIMVRKHNDKFKGGDYVYLKHRWAGLTVGWWMFGITAVLALLGFFPVDAVFGTTKWTMEIIMNLVVTAGMIVLGFLMPWIARRQRANANGLAFGRTAWYGMTGIAIVLLVAFTTKGLSQSILPESMGVGRWIVIVVVDCIIAAILWGMTRDGRTQKA
ncbi:APC family permease [Lacticaseibacillus sharpeae]|uniref:Amino acid transporter n=1 Tax=Lacticaseibacillus sharpeae JCM 1186 = DSM 20505 TaxID=1291052 RepID=A0A0R1ZNY9_9LACO|nr:APC family permease [Lacticaseibacillus sharpeae]KRM56170.1 Amino acid transporter [Lacticaseibacillus sharpeae JCM 1186 = DSM 20505]